MGKEKNKLKMGNFEIKYQYECDEPASCEYWHNKKSCKEDMNGLNHLFIEPIKGFVFDIWLCDNHFKLFKRKIKIQKW